MKILFVSYSDFLQNTYEGGKKCSLRNYTVLEKIYGQECIDGIVFSREYHDCDKENFVCGRLSRSKYNTFIQTFKGYTRGYTTDCEKLIIEMCSKNKYDIVYLDFSGYGVSIEKIAQICKCKIYVFFHDIEYLYEKKRAQKENPLYMLSAIAIRKSEKKVCKYADYVITLNGRDSKWMSKIYKRKSDLELPMSFENTVSDSDLINMKDDKYILFIGSYFGPNIDAIKWYYDNIADNVDLKLVIVGHNMEKLKDKYKHKNLEIVGTVDNLSKYYYGARAVVMPIQYGEGMKVKTAEALMYGKMIIGTDEAFEGYDIENGKEGVYCNTPNEFITAINNLKPENVYNEDSRKLYKNKYSIEASVNMFRKISEYEDR